MPSPRLLDLVSGSTSALDSIVDIGGPTYEQRLRPTFRPSRIKNDGQHIGLNGRLEPESSASAMNRSPVVGPGERPEGPLPETGGATPPAYSPRIIEMDHQNRVVVNTATL